MDKPFTAQMSFAGHTALVTGGESGIGFAKIWGTHALSLKFIG